MKQLFVYFFVLCLTFIVGGIPEASANNTVTINVNDNHTNKDITKDIFFIEGFQDVEWPWQITKKAKWAQYNQDPKTFFNISNNAFSKWFQFDIRNSSGDKQNLFLYIDSHFLQNIDIFIFEKNGALQRVWHTGLSRGLGSKPYPTSNYAFPLELSNHEVKKVYVHVSADFNSQIAFKLYSDIKFRRIDTVEKIVNGVVLGITFLMFIYTFLLFLFLRERKYIYYSVFAFSIFVCIGLTGSYLTLFPYLTFGYDESLFRIYMIANVCSLWGLLYSCFEFFNASYGKKKQKHYSSSKLRKYLALLVRILGINFSTKSNFGISVISITIVYTMVMLSVFSVPTAFLQSYVIALFMLLWGVYYIFVSLIKKNFLQFGYVVAIVLFLTGNLLSGLRFTNLISNSFLLVTPFYVVSGTIVIVVLLSLTYTTYREKRKKVLANNISRTRKRRYLEVVKYASEGMFSVTMEGGFKQVNPAFLKILNFETDKDLFNTFGSNFHDICENPRDFEELVSKLLDEASNGKEFTASADNKTKRKILNKLSHKMVGFSSNDKIVTSEIRLKTNSSDNKVITCNVKLRFSVDLDFNIGNSFGTDIVIIEGEISDLTLELERQSKLSYMQYHDGLTSLYNRNFMNKTLYSIIKEKYAKEGEDNIELPYGNNYLCFICINNLKSVNDSLGREAGDKYLKNIAKFIKEHSSENYKAVSLNSNEFAVIMEDSYIDQTLAFVEKLRIDLASLRFDYKGNVLGVSANIGVVDIAESKGSLSRLLTLADVTCEASKKKGSNVVLFYNSDLNPNVDFNNDVSINTMLYKAYDNKNVSYIKQNIFSSNKSKTVTAVELSACIQDENQKTYELAKLNRSLISGNLIAKFDEFNIENIIKLYSKDNSLKDLELIFVKFNYDTISDFYFKNEIINKLKTNCDLCQKLCIVINEDAINKNSSNVKDFVVRFKELGIKIATEFLGQTGIASFYFQQALGVDFVIIDIDELPMFEEDSKVELILESFVNLAKKLGIKTVIKNVNTEDIYKKVSVYKSDLLQGEYFSKPEKLKV